MDIRPYNTVINSLQARAGKQDPSKNQPNQSQRQPSSQALTNTPQQVSAPTATPSGAQRIAQTVQSTDTGLRTTETFQNNDNRQFSRVTTINFSENGISRDVIQQNPSGSFTRLEETFTQRDNGRFLRSLRFTDETGVVNTRVEDNVVLKDTFLLSGLRAANTGLPSAETIDTENAAPRGSQIDIRI